MINLSIPFTKDNNILSLVKEEHLPYVSEIYMPVPHNIIESARPFIEEESNAYSNIIEDQIKLAKSKGLKVSFIANKQFIEHTRLRSTSVRLCEFLKSMKRKYDIDKVVISNLYIIKQYGDYIKEMGIDIELSVLVGINSVEAFAQIVSTNPCLSSVCLGDYFVHDIEAIGYLKNTYPHIQLKVIPNHGCFVNCASEQQHHNYSSCTFIPDTENPIAYSSNAELNNANNLCATCRSEYGAKRSLKDVSFIRPDDIPIYDGLIDLFKISGREHKAEDIIKVIEAYGNKTYKGPLANLLDMDIGVGQDVLNEDLPSNIGHKRSTCDHKCYKCNYCETVNNFSNSHTTSHNIEV